MKFDIATDMLFELLNHRKLTAQYFAQKYKISVRTVFRYVDVLSLNVPVETQSGRTGGIYISDAYKLPVGLLSKEEYEAADEALEAMYSQLPEERFLNVRKKLAAQRKTDEKQLFFSGEANYLLIDAARGEIRNRFPKKSACSKTRRKTAKSSKSTMFRARASARCVKRSRIF